MQLKKWIVPAGLVLVVGVLLLGFFTHVRVGNDVDTSKRSLSRADRGMVGDVSLSRYLGAFRGDGVSISASEHTQIGKAKMFDGDLSSARVARKTGAGRIILVGNARQVCMFSVDRGGRAGVSRLGSAGCTRSDVASNPATLMVFWGPYGKDRERITFLAPDKVDSASVRTSNGSRDVSIINNVGDVVIPAEQHPVLTWKSRGKTYKQKCA